VDAKYLAYLPIPEGIVMHYHLPLRVFCLLLTVILLATPLASLSAQDYAMSGVVDVNSCVPNSNDPPPQLLDGARISSLVVEDVVLLSQPPYTADTEPLEIIEIPQGAYAIVYDIDEQTQNYFRVVFPCDGVNMTGWIPVSTIRFPARRANPKPAPPGCAIAQQIVDILDDEWTSNISGHVAVVADLFRSTGGDAFPRSFYYLTRNGREIRDRERVFETSGTFLINGSVLSSDIAQGNRLGFSVITSSRDSSLEFFGILFEVPEGCEFAD
jgi:hypothetical protein